VIGSRLDYDWKFLKQESGFWSEPLFGFSK
jgi:hypothetical protein